MIKKMSQETTFAERLSEALKEREIKPIELSRLCGINKSTISQYLSGKYTPKQDKVTKIAEVLGISPLRLLGYEDSAAENIWLGAHARSTGEFCRLPVVGRVSAGIGIPAEQDIVDYEICDIEFNDDRHFYLTVSGDSMSPKLDDGDRVLVRRQNCLENGEIGVFLVDNEDGVVKRYRFDGDTLSLISINPNWPPRSFKGREIERVRIIGRVIRSVRVW